MPYHAFFVKRSPQLLTHLADGALRWSLLLVRSEALKFSARQRTLKLLAYASSLV